MAEKKESSLIGYDQLDDDKVNDSEKPAGAVMETFAASVSKADIASQPERAVELESVLTIQNVKGLYQPLVNLLASRDRIEIDASAVTVVDTAALQMLIVFKRTAINAGKEVSIDFPSEKFIAASDLLGLSEMLGVQHAAAGFF